MTETATRTRIRMVALLGVITVGTAACGGGGGGGKAAPIPKVTSTTKDAEKVKILADFNAYTDVYARSLADPKVTTQMLAEHITGEALETLTNSRIQLLTSGRGIRSEAIHHPAVTSVAGTTAMLDDCITNNRSHLFDIRNGQPLPDVTGGNDTSGNEVTVQLDGGTWKVSKVVRKASACPG